MDPQAFLGRIIRRIGADRRRHADAAPDEVRTLLIDPFADDGAGEACPGSTSTDRIARACGRIRAVRTKGELLEMLAREVGEYSLRDLEQMHARFEAKVGNLPEDYRARLLEAVREQIFSAHHRLLVLSRSGAAAAMTKPPDPALPAYCRMVADACSAKAREKDPKYLYLKYLLAAFVIFVLEEPAHPVGTPFPGGQIVDEWEGTYLCPVREMADDVAFALCPYCPAVQSTEPTYPEMRARREERRRRECLANYRTNYKG